MTPGEALRMFNRRWLGRKPKVTNEPDHRVSLNAQQIDPGRTPNADKPIALYLEHEDEMRLLYQEALSTYFEVHDRYHYKSALEDLEREPPALIISDLYLIYGPQHGIELGIKFLRAARDLMPRDHRYLIIVLSKFATWLETGKGDFQFGTGRRYTEEEGHQFRRELQEIGVKDDRYIITKVGDETIQSTAQTIHNLYLDWRRT